MIKRSDYVKCSKKNPATCRLHRKQYEVFQTALQAVKTAEKREKEAKAHAWLMQDLQSMKLKETPEGLIASVYRCGVDAPPEKRGIEKEAYEKADSFAPEGRQGRNTAVFATPTLGTVGRWVRGNSWNKNILDVQVRELRVNADQVYVYDIHAWEKTWYTGEYTERDIASAKNYWNTGITLREWVEKAKKGEIQDPENWEILLPKQGIQKTNILPPASVVKGQEEESEEIERILRNNRKELRILSK